MQQQEILSEEKFVKLFLSLLCKNGIFRINEAMISKKLYDYSKRKEYKELFQNITSLKDSINITNGIKYERDFANKILTTPTNPPQLILLYDAATEITDLKAEMGLCDEALLQMMRMVDEITLLKKVESHSKKKREYFQ